jgi:hypothetical protein
LACLKLHPLQNRTVDIDLNDWSQQDASGYFSQ